MVRIESLWGRYTRERAENWGSRNRHTPQSDLFVVIEGEYITRSKSGWLRKVQSKFSCGRLIQPVPVIMYSSAVSLTKGMILDVVTYSSRQEKVMLSGTHAMILKTSEVKRMCLDVELPHPSKNCPSNVFWNIHYNSISIHVYQICIRDDCKWIVTNITCH